MPILTRMIIQLVIAAAIRGIPRLANKRPPFLKPEGRAKTPPPMMVLNKWISVSKYL